MTITSQTILHLSLIKGIGSVTVQQVIAALSSSASFADLYHMSSQDLQRLGLSERHAQLIVEGLADTALLEKELLLLQRHSFSLITLDDASYPHGLAHIHGPPPVLYVQGAALPSFSQCIAVVGSRDANSYGQRVINKIVPDLVAAGKIIVSGGALGADAMAHCAALDAQGKTTAVLGSGLLKPYPLSNRRLFEDIVERGGSIVSIFPLQEIAHAGNFPARNRIISGLSEGCLVVQAAEKSGARITANYALEQGRNVYAVPGMIDDPLSAGCHALILDGATLVRSAVDIVGDILGTDSATLFLSKNMLSNSSEKSPGKTLLSSDQSQLIAACQHPCSFEDLLQISNLSSEQLSEELFALQCAGHLIQEFTGFWIRAE